MGSVASGWVFASHQMGAAAAAAAAGAIRDLTGEYTMAWFGAGRCVGWPRCSASVSWGGGRAQVVASSRGTDAGVVAEAADASAAASGGALERWMIAIPTSTTIPPAIWMGVSV